MCWLSGSRIWKSEVLTEEGLSETLRLTLNKLRQRGARFRYPALSLKATSTLTRGLWLCLCQDFVVIRINKPNPDWMTLLWKINHHKSQNPERVI